MLIYSFSFVLLFISPSSLLQSQSFQRLGCIWLFDDGVVMVVLCTQSVHVGLLCDRGMCHVIDTVDYLYDNGEN